MRSESHPQYRRPQRKYSDFLDYEEQVMIDDEELKEYGKGGLHLIIPGDRLNNKYISIMKLACGASSVVWLCQQIQNNQYYAVKLSKSKNIYSEMALDELQLLKDIKKNHQNPLWKQYNYPNTHVIQHVDYFPIFGNNGRHLCLTFEVLGPTLLDIIQFYEEQGSRLNLKTVKIITKQLLYALTYIHDSCQIIHTDLKPENIMLRIPNIVPYLLGQDSSRKKVKVEKPNSVVWKGLHINLDEIDVVLVDFGNACWVHNHLSEEISTLEYRSPEAILQAPYSLKTDIWSLACVIFEMLTNNYLFKPDEEQTDSDHLAMITELLGPIPEKFGQQGKKYRHLYENNQLKNVEKLEQYTVASLLFQEYNYPVEEAVQINQFFQYLLKWDPCERPQAKDILQHQFLNDYRV